MIAPQRLSLHGRDMKLLVTGTARRTLAIEVHPDPQEGARLVVRAPVDSMWDEIHRRILRRAGWVVRQARHFDAFLPGPQTKQYVNGASCRLLGRQLVMRVARGKVAVVRKGRELVVSVPEPGDQDSVAVATTQWFRLQGKTELSRLLGQWLKHPLLQPMQDVRLQIRQLNRRWGSFSARGTLTLNVNLVEMQPGCIDYVIVHELCHHWHPDHGEGFWKLLTDVLPDWPRWKKTLERTALD